jgi:DNA-binding SARP family transcriptional activator
MLDGFELEIDGRLLPMPTPTVQRLLAFLALRGHPHQRVYVAGVLWLESNQGRANANLRSAVWRTTRYGHGLITSTARQVTLGEDVRVDVGEVCNTAWRVIADNGECELADVQRLSLAGELLPDWYEDWVQTERERVRQLRLHALDQICQHLPTEGRYAEAIEAGLAAVAIEPLRESSHCALIKAHLAEGNASEALRQFQSLRHLLMSELRLEPSLAVAALIAHVADSVTAF